jgi:prophage regulatory protein
MMMSRVFPKKRKTHFFMTKRTRITGGKGMNANANNGRLLRLNQVLERIPVSKSTWWAGVRCGRYPKPIKLSPRITVWKETDIDRLCRGEDNEHLEGVTSDEGY